MQIKKIIAAALCAAICLCGCGDTGIEGLGAPATTAEEPAETALTASEAPKTTAEPETSAETTTAAPTTAAETTTEPTTTAQTTTKPTAAAETTAKPTTAAETTAKPTTAAETTTAAPTTVAETTEKNSGNPLSELFKGWFVIYGVNPMTDHFEGPMPWPAYDSEKTYSVEDYFGYDVFKGVKSDEELTVTEESGVTDYLNSDGESVDDTCYVRLSSESGGEAIVYAAKHRIGFEKALGSKWLIFTSEDFKQKAEAANGTEVEILLGGFTPDGEPEGVEFLYYVAEFTYKDIKFKIMTKGLLSLDIMRLTNEILAQ